MILESSPSLVILKHVGIPTIPPSSPRSESKYTVYPTSSLLKTPRGATSYQSLSRPVLVPDILPESYSAQSGRISYWFPKIDTSLSQSQRFVQHICIHMLVALYISSAIFWSWQMRYTKVAYIFCLAAVFNQSREIFPLKSTKFPSIFVTSCWFSASSKNYLSWFAITNRLHMCFPCNSIFDFAHRCATPLAVTFYQAIMREYLARCSRTASNVQAAFSALVAQHNSPTYDPKYGRHCIM